MNKENISLDGQCICVREYAEQSILAHGLLCIKKNELSNNNKVMQNTWRFRTSWSMLVEFNMEKLETMTICNKLLIVETVTSAMWE